MITYEIASRPDTRMTHARIELLTTDDTSSSSAIAVCIAELFTQALCLHNPGWLHDAALTRDYIDALLVSVLDKGNGVVFIDILPALHGGILRGALIFVNSMDQARSYEPFKRMYEILSARYRTETEVWRDTTLSVDPLMIEVTPRMELLGVDSAYAGQGVGMGLMRDAEEYCMAQHRLDTPPWHVDYAQRILKEGFEKGELVVGLDTSWDQHTPYYQKQGYTLFHHIVGDVQYPTAEGWCNGDMVIMSFFKILSK